MRAGWQPGNCTVSSTGYDILMDQFCHWPSTFLLKLVIASKCFKDIVYQGLDHCNRVNFIFILSLELRKLKATQMLSLSNVDLSKPSEYLTLVIWWLNTCSSVVQLWPLVGIYLELKTKFFWSKYTVFSNPIPQNSFWYPPFRLLPRGPLTSGSIGVWATRFFIRRAVGSRWPLN